MARRSRVGSRLIMGMSGRVSIHCRSRPAARRREGASQRGLSSSPASRLRCSAALVQRVARRAAELGGQRHRLLQRQLAQQHAQHAQRRRRQAVVRGASAARGACSTSTNSPRRRLRIGRQPGRQLGGGQRGHGLELLGQLAAQRHAAAAAPAPASSRGQRLDAVRRLEQHLRRRRLRQRAAARPRARRRAGRKPTKPKPLLRASPATLSAASALLAPGIGSTR